MTQLPSYYDPSACAMPPGFAMPRGFERARVSVKVTSENFVDVMTVVAWMLHNGADFIGPPIDLNSPHEIRARLAAGDVACASDGLRNEAVAAPKQRTRKPSVATLVKRAEKTGKTVTSAAIEGDKVVLTFSDPPVPSEANAPRDASVVAPDRIIELRKRRR